ncbi:molecular chaperone HscC [Marinobacter nanhaiticus D15-8W]|uniref:Molecular chaperone HscC n=1 Tax=Marinobacter nanhaiticus D15-8W TaxID=626887 RepID=N6X2H7_9GAMM|nr:molecular chaperone HscC [Marinobacter nanhaiticus]ENO15253.1 molecular chaperone HscC [Marinobacter nanhaiticus D15-8W]BES69045.1 molecular chaperone HscC [Marinobacter nanhaiticus D15-8W]
MAVIGIDLGTTNSLASIWRDDESVLIPNALGEFLTPSVVSVDHKGIVLVGKAAKERLVTHPQSTVSQFKRLMGTAEKLSLNGKSFSPEELSALVLKQLKADAESFLGEPVEEAIISVPAYFNNNQRTATLNAARLANLHVERLINEPTAAALAYGLKEHRDESTFIVVDLGGGTLDVSILEKFDDLLEVHATSGDSFLGGEDFTRALMAGVLARWELGSQALSREERAHVYRVCDQAKKVLCEETTVAVSASIQNRTLTTTISREDFLGFCSSLIERLRTPLERAVRDSGLGRDGFDDVIIVGGASRMPAVKNTVGRMFGRIPSANLDPDLVVAMGAAIQAALKQRNQALRDTVLTDVCPFSLGIASAQTLEHGIRSGFFSVLIPRNTVIPASRNDRFYTVEDYQAAIRIQVYQGEQRLVKNNIKIGELTVPVPPRPASEEAVDVRFTYDINGILEVLAEVPSTGFKDRIVIRNTDTELSDGEIESALKRLESLKFHPREDIANIAVMMEAERMFAEALGEEREHIGALILELENAMDSQDRQRVDTVRVAVESRLDTIRTHWGMW